MTKEEKIKFCRTHSTKECVEEFGISRQAVYQYKKRNEKYTIPKMTDEERIEFAKNHTVKECGEAWGIGYSGAYAWLKDRNLLKVKFVLSKYEAMKRLPVYPEGLFKFELGINNIPESALICESDNGLYS